LFLSVRFAVREREFSVCDTGRNDKPYSRQSYDGIYDYRADGSCSAENHRYEIEIEDSVKSPVYSAENNAYAIILAIFIIFPPVVIMYGKKNFILWTLKTEQSDCSQTQKR